MSSISLQGALGSVAVVSGKIQRASAAGERGLRVLDTKPSTNVQGGIRWENVTGNIEFSDVNFQYKEGSPVLTNLNLRIPSGKQVQILG